jgi:phosphoglycerate kinase
MAPTDGLRSIDELELAHQRVLIRVDFDVPLDAAGNVGDDRKLRLALPTIEKATKSGARVVLATHLGAAGQPAVSLEPVAARLSELLGQELYLPDECVGEAARKVVSDLREGQICVLENLRFVPEEAQSDDVFARKLLGLCSVYVGEAFGQLHLPQTSLFTLPRLVKERGIGYQMRAELDALSRVGTSAVGPFVGVLGGASLERRLPLFELMLRRCSAICVGGAVATTLLAARSVDVKASPHDREQLAMARALLARARDAKVELLLPVDALVARAIDATDAQVVGIGAIPSENAVFDVGPRTVEAFRTRVQAAKTVLWHGALGVVENPAFSAGTSGVMTALAEAPAFGVVTGDSVATAAAAAGLEQTIGFVSAGGAASLAFIEGKKLPGLEALRG